MSRHGGNSIDRDSLVSYNLQGLKSQSIHRSLISDKISVRSIMDSCTDQMGPARKDLQKLSEEKVKTDEAMDRLLQLYKEYTDQI